ncbi:hypothetical protein ACCO45_003621 [Purpureocillium lilacinum]|uniref:Uncharacterized protein n=1 Tax=Purpureocillium lilacinum TaxID=33203 RepID=A0ACC4E196_PURLI
MLSYDNSMPVNGVNGQDAAPSGPGQSASNRASSAAAGGRAQKHHHIWLVTGPAGVRQDDGGRVPGGRAGRALHRGRLEPPLAAAQFHTEANIEKMRSGVPLTDADRWDWLTALRDESMGRLNRGSEGVVVTCSALKRKYRDVIRVAAYYDHDILVHFIFLSASPEVLLERVSNRKGHYMGANMVKSQFDILEPPRPGRARRLQHRREPQHRGRQARRTGHGLGHYAGRPLTMRRCKATLRRGRFHFFVVLALPDVHWGLE